MLTETVDSRWSSLYKLGGAVAIAIAVLLVGEGVVYAVLPNRSTPVEFLALFRDNWLTGLLNFDLLGMICLSPVHPNDPLALRGSSPNQ